MLSVTAESGNELQPATRPRSGMQVVRGHAARTATMGRAVSTGPWNSMKPNRAFVIRPA
jgi:hypothetical protein